MINKLVALLEESRRRGFLGPGPVEDHLDRARAFSVVVDEPVRALDLGAGGGLPGMVLAEMCWPNTQWVFLDSQSKRTAFLIEAVEELGLEDRVQVVTARAEEVGQDPSHRGIYDLVTSRSFGPPAVVGECACPLLIEGGVLVVSEPPSVAVEERWPGGGLDLLGADPAEGVEVDTEAGPVHFVKIFQRGLSPAKYPRRVGIPTKRPLF